MSIGCLGIELDNLPRLGASLPVQVEAPEHAGTGNKHLVVDDVLAQACSATPAKCMHADPLAEIRVPRQRLLVGRPTLL